MTYRPRFLARLGAAVGLVMALTGLAAVPVALTVLGGLPTASAISRAVAQRYVSPSLALGIAAAVGWVAYSYLLGWAAADVAYALRHRAPIRHGPPRWARPVTTRLAALVLVSLGRITLPAGHGAQPPPAPLVAPAPAHLVAAQIDLRTPQAHVVVAGDNLWDLALDYYGDGTAWRRIWEANAAAVPDPRELSVGTTLAIPPPGDIAGGPVYTVRPGDSLWSIAEEDLGAGQDWPELWAANQDRAEPDGAVLDDPSLIRPGWNIDVPAPVNADPAPAAPTPEVPTRPGTSTASPTPTLAAATPPMRPASPPSHGSPTPAPSSQAGREQDHSSVNPAVEVAGGYLVTASLGAAVGAALTAARLRRRRRRVPAEPAPVIAVHDPLVTATVEKFQRGTRLGALGEDADQEALGVEPAATTPPDGVVPIGRVGEAELEAAVLGGLSFGGSGPVFDVVRAAAVTLLSQAPSDIQLIIVGSTLARALFGRDTDMAGLTVTADLGSALRVLEVELVRRNRILDQLDASDAAGLAEAHPEEALVTTVVVADDIPLGQSGRLGAILGAGRHLSVGALLVGESVAEVALEVGDGPVISAVVPAEHPLAASAGAALYHLGHDEAAEIVEALAAARGEEIADDLAEVGFDAPELSAAPRLRVQILGLYRITTPVGVEITGLRDKAAELFALLLLNPAGVPVERAIETLWPEVAPAAGRKRFRTVLSNLRTTLGDALGPEVAAPVGRIGEVCRLDLADIDCDLWAFERAVEASATASDVEAKIAALRDAADSYRGDLADGAYYAWVDAPREKLRDQTVNVLVRISELAAEDAHGAIAFLERAFELDPYGEEVARRLMRLQAGAGNPDAARRTYARLARVLEDDLDADPAPETTALVQGLLATRSGDQADRVAARL